MLKEPENTIQQQIIPEVQKENLPTETHVSEQGVENLDDEQMETVTGGGLFKATKRAFKGAFKGAIRGFFKL